MTPGIGDHLRSRVVRGGTWRVVGRDRKHILVRCVEDGVPARILRSELDRWEIVWSPKGDPPGPGLEGLVRQGRFWVRVDAPQRERSAA